MAQYCSNGSEATVLITSPEKLKFFTKNTPITIEVSDVPTYFEIYTHQMNQPIDKQFNKLIADVQLFDDVNDWVFSGQYPPSNPIVHKQCPLLNFSPINDSLHIDGKRLYSNFDTFYNDNIGSCTYKVFFVGYQLKIVDSKNAQFKKVYPVKPTFEVVCGEGCPEGWCRCETNIYPGYTCTDPEPIKQELRAARNQVRAIRGE